MALAAEPVFDPYAEKPSFWKAHAQVWWTAAVFVLSVLLPILSFPPYSIAECGYVFAVPAIFWAYLKPGFRRYATVVLAAQAISWTIILGWLYHVSWLGVLLLGPFVGIWVGVWYLAVWWVIPRIHGRQTALRIFAVFGLAALWVLVEWTRTWLLSGFPWLPLAATQWQRSVVLQIASYTGASGVSFTLIVFNFGFAAYAHRLFREKQRGLRKRSPEFMAALLTLILPTFYLIFTETGNQQRQPFLRIAVVQPAIPQALKWDPSQSDMIFNTLGGLTARAASERPDLILWPEASTPFAVKGQPAVQEWVEQLVKKCGVPLLLGSASVTDRDTPNETWQNAVFLIDPVSGLQSKGYAKQHLVPFGEYVPFRPLLGWLGKFVPLGDGDFLAGKDAGPIVISTAHTAVAVGTLICYEDIFPDLARREAQSGAELFAVLTNNAWYGTGGAAYQHAAHSVLRAVETRRPFVRCGNNGWSGWIDEFGNIRDVMTNEKDTVYFRGTHLFKLTRDQRWIGRDSFYTQHGDWFVGLSAALALLAGIAVKLAKGAVADPATEAIEGAEPPRPF
jgi:apolipoprotein N-acyltransferase